MTGATGVTSVPVSEAEIFANYLRDRKVLIADPSAASRSGLFGVLHELGAQTSNLTLVNTFEHAQAAIESLKPQVVIVEFDIGRRCGLDLLQAQRAQRPEETKNCLFVVVTSNTSQTAVAKAAEEDIDAYILKPYTMESVRKTILQATIRKINPPRYYLAIESGKKALSLGQIDEAEAEFSRAAQLDPAPSLAYYYLGQVKYMRKILEESKGSYQKGLSFNRIHYKCLVGLYELLMQQNKPHEAYEIVKKISQYFPANPKRLTEVLRLAVVTSQFSDIEKYYATFVNIDERNETLVRYVCAALVVCGRHYLASNIGHSRALELFRKAAVTGQGRANILKEIVLALISHGLTKEAQFFMDRFPLDTRQSDDYLLLRLFIADAENQIHSVINEGRLLISKGVADERLYTTMIRRGVEARLGPMAMDEIMSQAVARMPDRKPRFDEVLSKATTQFKVSA